MNVLIHLYINVLILVPTMMEAIPAHVMLGMH